ncbi:MAG: DUF433 domain-containing protein [Desulfobacterales bacterium]|nr:DUF433 domain-containing protein [Desulfobacterales bacterium]
MQVDWKNYIVSTPNVLHGKPRLKGTNIRVSHILGNVAAGKSFMNIVEKHPELSLEQIAACLDYASDFVEIEFTM